MELRFNHRKAYPDVFQTILKLESFMKNSGLDPVLYEFIKIRASQINGCAYCLDKHTRDLHEMGEQQKRINVISVWREVPFFTDKEKTVLALTEAVTLIAEGGVSDALYEQAREHFNEQEYMSVIMGINTINYLNRIAISTGMFPGCFD